MSLLPHRAIKSIFAVASLLLTVSSAIGEQSSPPTLGEQEEAAIRAAAERVADSVVQIRTVGGLEEVDRTLMPDGPTTGLVISPDGWILSSAFNFVQQPASILVTLPSGEQASAKLVAKDHSRMLVLLKLEGVHELAVPEFASASDIRVGEWAIAVGRTYRTDRTNLSVGVVSATNRMLGKAIQTDAHVSVANYGGPLVDIHGQVVGVIVPMAPQATSEVAGAEWYDSGIGFAVPIASIQSALERMKRGDDQFPGILGVSFTMGLAQSSPAEIAAVRPNSPAGSAGFRKGDRIIAVNDRSVSSQTDLRFALGPRYAGETIQVKLKRGDNELEHTVTLVGKLEPYHHPFLGVLPMRPESVTERMPDQKATGESAKIEKGNDHKQPSEDSDDSDDQPATMASANEDATASNGQQGVVIRMVYPGSPAADAGVQIGDRLIRIDEANCRTVGTAIAAMNTYAPGNKVSVRVTRGDKPLDIAVTLGEMPTSVPGELPPAIATPSSGVASPANKQEAVAEKTAKPELRDLKLAEFTETCQVYVPAPNEAGRPAGVILWLHAPGEPPTDGHFHQWQSICDRDSVILVAPKATDPSRWERTEIEYLRRLIERVVSQYRIDPRRVVVYGKGGGGAMAAALALASRDIFSGVAITDATLLRTLQVPDNDPSARLAIYAGLPADESQAALIRSGLKKLSEAGYPVTAVTLSNSADFRQRVHRERRRIDTLDRF